MSISLLHRANKGYCQLYIAPCTVYIKQINNKALLTLYKQLVQWAIYKKPVQARYIDPRNSKTLHWSYRLRLNKQSQIQRIQLNIICCPVHFWPSSKSAKQISLGRFLTFSCPISFINCSILLMPAAVCMLAAITVRWPGYRKTVFAYVVA